MDYVICATCGKKFKRKRSQIKLAIKHYCSVSCAEKGRKNGTNVLCATCGVEVYKQRKAIENSKSGAYFCSKLCLLKWISKTNNGHPNWKGGEFSYRQRFIRNSDIKIQCVLCKEQDSRMLAVHHIDKDRSNNFMKNLAWLCHNCHFLVHHYELEKKEFNKKIYDKKV